MAASRSTLKSGAKDVQLAAAARQAAKAQAATERRTAILREILAAMAPTEAAKPAQQRLAGEVAARSPAPTSSRGNTSA